MYNLGFAQIPQGYYDSAKGLSGKALEKALHNIIKGNVAYPYTSSSTDVWDILKKADQDPNNPNNVILIYTGKSVNAAQEYNNGKGWTREHVWAKSRGNFGTTTGVGTDCHNLHACSIPANSARSNRWFAQADEPYYQDGVATGCYTSSTKWVWEPRDAVKGDIARTIFYMAVRYDGDNGEPDLKVIDSIPSDNHTTAPVHAKLSDLLKWNEQDPPDSFEKHRNDVVYGYQHNRNPFIDHPEYAEMIWGTPSGTPAAPANLTVSATSTNINLSWSDDGNETAYYVYRSTDNSNFNQLAKLNANTTSYSDANVTKGTTYYYFLKAYNDKGYSTASDTVNAQLSTSNNNYASDLFISEYVEGSSYNKAIEISNFTGASIDLSHYSIKKQTNGSGNWTSGLSLSGTLANGKSYVIANSSASNDILNLANLSTSASEMTFNGNDPISLWKDGKLIDIIGTFNDASYFAKDVTKIRNSNVSSPNTTYTPSEWTDHPKDYIDNLGKHTFDGASSSTCEAPTGLTASNISENAADISWNKVNNASGYILDYRTSGASAWNQINSSTNSYNLTKLSSSTTYEYKVATNCSNGTSDFSPVKTFKTLEHSVTYCTPTGYTYYEWIDYFELSNIKNSSGASSNGYSDFTDKIINLVPGNSYSLYFEPAFRNSIYTEYWSVWIDYNHDGDFDDANELLDKGYTNSDGLYYFSITIPSDAKGNTRLRIMMNDNGYHDACYKPQYGEIEDYSVSFGSSKNYSVPLENKKAQAALKNLVSTCKIYPNPVTDKLYITNNKNSIISIYSLEGQKIMEQKISGNSINLSKLNRGIYILELNNGKKIYRQKIIKN